VVAAALIAGVLLGTGFAQTALHATDGLTWLGDPARGEVVQVNPSTGRPETRLTVTPPGDGLAVAQTDGLLVITDTTTGLVTVIDVATLTTAGRYRGTGLESTRILLTSTDLFVADLARGFVTRLDPATAAPVGAAWSPGRALADVVIDESGIVWALDVTGALHRLVWGQAELTLVEPSAARRIPGTGPDSVLAPHDVGVTVVAPEGRLISQIGVRPTEAAVTAAALTAPVFPPIGLTPVDLVPVTMPEDDAAILFVDQTRTRAVDTAALGCLGPGPPAVHIGLVYLPCANQTVLVVDRDGGLVRSIAAPGEERAILTVHNGQLFINAPGASTAAMVDEEGQVREAATFDDTVDIRDPDDNIAFTTPPEPTDRSSERGDGTPAGTGTATTGSGSASQLPSPTNVTAAVSGVFVTVTWQHPGGATGFRILNEAGVQVGSVDGGDADQAVVNMAQGGITARLLVRAVRGSEFADSAPSDPITTTERPLPPASVGLAFAPNGAAVDVTVTWPASQPRGAPITGYRVQVTSATGDTQTRDVPATPTSVQITVGCGSQCATGVSVTATVIAQTQNDGSSDPASATTVYTAPPPPVPQDGDLVVASFGEEEVCDTSFPGCDLAYEYTVNLNPPQAWRDFSGTCTIHYNATVVPIACDATSHYFGIGGGATYTVRVRACLTSCVTSNSIEMMTSPGERIWCGTLRC
jgi:hypothetical protein